MKGFLVMGAENIPKGTVFSDGHYSILEQNYIASLKAYERLKTDKKNEKFLKSISREKPLWILQAAISAMEEGVAIPPWASKELVKALKGYRDSKGEVSLDDKLNLTKKAFGLSNYKFFGMYAYELKEIHGLSKVDAYELARYEYAYSFDEEVRSSKDITDGYIDKCRNLYKDKTYIFRHKDGYADWIASVCYHSINHMFALAHAGKDPEIIDILFIDYDFRKKLARLRLDYCRKNFHNLSDIKYRKELLDKSFEFVLNAAKLHSEQKHEFRSETK